MLYKQFENYLLLLKISSKSLKNYKSDVNHFLNWAASKLKELGSYVNNLEELTPFLDRSIVSNYIDSLKSNSIPVRTINRRLSTLRHLSKFLTSVEALDSDFTLGIRNVNSGESDTSSHEFEILKNFISHLEKEKISKNTIKNYASDIRQFLAWVNQKNYV